METAPPNIATFAAAATRRRLWVRRCVVVGVLLCLPLAGAMGVAGYFRLSSPTKALRSTVMSSVPGQWNKRFALHVGAFSMGIVRAGSRFFRLPPEPRAAIEAFHGAEFGVYRLEQNAAPVDGRAVFVAADKAMKLRGWERIVGVVQGEKLVGVYIPRAGVSTAGMECCLMVLQERDLVVASARGNLEPLLELAEAKWPSADTMDLNRSKLMPHRR